MKTTIKIHIINPYIILCPMEYIATCKDNFFEKILNKINQLSRAIKSLVNLNVYIKEQKKDPKDPNRMFTGSSSTTTT